MDPPRHSSCQLFKTESNLCITSFEYVYPPAPSGALLIGLKTPQYYFPCHNPSYNKTWSFLLQKVPLFHDTCRHTFFSWLEVGHLSMKNQRGANPLRSVMTKISQRHVKKYVPGKFPGCKESSRFNSLPEEYLPMLNADYELGCKVSRASG